MSAKSLREARSEATTMPIIDLNQWSFKFGSSHPDLVGYGLAHPQSFLQFPDAVKLLLYRAGDATRESAIQGGLSTGDSRRTQRLRPGIGSAPSCKTFSTFRAAGGETTRPITTLPETWLGEPAQRSKRLERAGSIARFLPARSSPRQAKSSSMVELTIRREPSRFVGGDLDDMAACPRLTDGEQLVGHGVPDGLQVQQCIRRM